MLGTCATGKGKGKYVNLRTKLRAFMELTTPSEEEGDWAASITLPEEQQEDREYSQQTMGNIQKIS